MKMQRMSTEMDSNHNGPHGAAADHRGSLQRAIEHARRVAGAQAARPGVLDPDGAAIWLRFCSDAGLGSGEPQY